VPSNTSSLKPKKSYAEQLAILKTRGLEIEDEALALHVLAHHNYYRLSAYRLAFTSPKSPDKFPPGTQFRQIWRLYVFDQDLRRLVWSACERLEVSLRARWAYVLAHSLNDPLAYQAQVHFTDQSFSETRRRIEEDINKSYEPFVEHHKKKGQHWPPIWVVSEVITFGTLTRLVRNLKEQRIRQEIADAYALDERAFCSMIHHLALIRNKVAHHARLWDNPPKVIPLLPKVAPVALLSSLDYTPAGRGKVYNSLVLLAHLLRQIDPKDPWPSLVRDHLLTLDPALLPRLGAPGDWSSRVIWAAP
jgi:abortive infection bacteriophage resistance protein